MTLLPKRANLLLIVVLLLSFTLAIPVSAQAPTPEPNDIELALVLDGSGSIGIDNFRIMKEGIAAALANPACVPEDGSIWVSVTQFGADATVEMPLTEVTVASIAGIAATVANIPYKDSFTNYQAGIETGLSTYAGTGRRQVMNFATDGQPNTGDIQHTPTLRQMAIDAGVDELDIEAIGDPEILNIPRLQDLAHPQPGVLWENTPLPTAPGWVKRVENYNEFADSICAKFVSIASGRLVVSKVTNPRGAGHVFDFSLTGPNTNETFQLKDGESFSTEANLADGTYTVTEIYNDDGAGGEDGWTTAISCDTAPPTTSETNTIDVMVDGPVECIVTNTADPTSVQLADFSGAVKPDHILLSWETVSEVNNLGFNVYRSDAANGAQSLISATMIPANNPGATQGSTYSFQDTNVQPGVTYYYWLEDLDATGQASKAGPVAVTFLGPTSVGLNSFTAAASSAPALLGLGGAAMAALAGLAVARRKQD